MDGEEGVADIPRIRTNPTILVRSDHPQNCLLPEKRGDTMTGHDLPDERGAHFSGARETGDFFDELGSPGILEVKAETSGKDLKALYQSLSIGCVTRWCIPLRRVGQRR